MCGVIGSKLPKGYGFKDLQSVSTFKNILKQGYAENDTSALCHPKYCLHSAGYPGLGRCLNAKYGLADASTSAEIRNESTRGHYSPPRTGQMTVSDPGGSTTTERAGASAS